MGSRLDENLFLIKMIFHRETFRMSFRANAASNEEREQVIKNKSSSIHSFVAYQESQSF